MLTVRSEECGAQELFVDTAQIPQNLWASPSGVSAVPRYRHVWSGERYAKRFKIASRCIGVDKAGQRVAGWGKAKRRSRCWLSKEGRS